MKKIVILQSNYLPWKGYFELINSADEFYFHDDVKYTKNDWRNRNQIYLNFKKKWLTIPCGVNQNRNINEVFIADNSWKKKHFELISTAYKNSKYFNHYIDFFFDFYMNKKLENLSLINKYLIKNISKKFLNIDTKFYNVENFKIKSKKQSKVLDICKKVSATKYLSGPSGQNYLKIEDFKKEGIILEYFNYGPYLKYNQFSYQFSDNISILDLLFNVGPDAKNFIKSQ